MGKWIGRPAAVRGSWAILVALGAYLAIADGLASQGVGTGPGVGLVTRPAAPVTSTPADQAGNATATFKMNGLACALTPSVTGRVVFTVSGDLKNSVILDGVTYKLVYGTGAAPANAAAATGTVISATRSVAVPVAAQAQGFSITASATGLITGVALWFDLQVADVTGGTASVANVTCMAMEV